MVMNENISRLMDGELRDDELDAVCSGLAHPEASQSWACYHVIGDALRGDCRATPGFGARFAQKLAAEPTVLAPRRRVPQRTASFGWAAAATLAAVAVVGYTAFSLVDDTPAAIAKAREAGAIRAAQVRPQVHVPADYLLAHQEYSPAVALQGVSPYMRAVVNP
jgi:sigma-E factor negative regulatory protein RseA